MQGLPGARTGGPVGGQGLGSRPQSSERDRQAEEGGRKDELACPSRGQTDFAQAPVCQLFSTVLLRAESWQSGALRLGRGGTRFPHFWPGVRSVWPWLGGLKGPSRRPSAEHGRPEVRLTLGASA